MTNDAISQMSNKARQINKEVTVNRNFLKAVFWDYPQFHDYNSIRSVLQNSREKNDIQIFRWFLARFLERGRVKDVAMIFRITEVRDNLNELRISDYAYRKWQRLLNVYGNPS